MFRGILFLHTVIDQKIQKFTCMAELAYALTYW